MIDWASDPELNQLREEFIDSFMTRLQSWKDLQDKMLKGQIDPDTQMAAQVLTHRLAGVAETYGFSMISQVSGALDDLFSSKNLKALSERERDGFELLSEGMGFTLS